MKKYHTDSDVGSFLFGNKDFSFKLPNGYGDCENTVFVFDNNKEFWDYCIKQYGKEVKDRYFKWKMSLSGKFNLYNYDCSDINEKDIEVSFDGSYNLYLRNNSWNTPILAIIKK